MKTYTELELFQVKEDEKIVKEYFKESINCLHSELTYRKLNNTIERSCTKCPMVIYDTPFGTLTLMRNK